MFTKFDIYYYDIYDPAIPAGERLQTYTLDRAATGTRNVTKYKKQKNKVPTSIVYLLV